MRRELRRDEGLLRLSKATRWMVAAAVAGAGLMSAAVAAALPGRSSAATRTEVPPQPVTSVAPSSTDGSASGATEGASEEAPEGETPATPATAPTTLTPPTAPPQTVYNPPVVSSGGS